MMTQCYPYRGLGRYQKELGNFYKNFSQLSPASEIIERNDSYKIDMELPGVNKEDVSIEIKDDVLTVKGEKKSKELEKDEQTYSNERYFGTFEKQFSLPGNIKTEDIKASHNNGVLELILPKSEEAKPRTIVID